MASNEPDIWHGTTILSVRKNGKVVIAGDGQVSLGPTVIKATARKVRPLGDGSVIAGFAGATADAFTLFERLEAKLEQHPGQLTRACVDLAKDWRTDRYLRRLEAMMAVADKDVSLVMTGTGDVLEPDLGLIGIGSGGAYALYSVPRDFKQLAGRYFSRRQIEAGALKNRAQPIAWIADPVDAFFLHIQGSGRIRLPNQKVLRVGFAGHNGHPYTAIGRVLIKQGAMEREKVSMQSIRAWLSANPRRAPDIMKENARYVFFRRLTGPGPIGAQGVALTPGRSLAVDPKFISYGTPIWLDTKDPLTANKPFQRLLIAQDTGGAIKGLVRGDIFFGYGKTAAQYAGHMNRKGEYYILLPRAAAPST